MFINFVTWLLPTPVPKLRHLKACVTALSPTHLIDNLFRLFRQADHSVPRQSFPVQIVKRISHLSNSNLLASAKPHSVMDWKEDEVLDLTGLPGSGNMESRSRNRLELPLIDNKKQPAIIVIDGSSPAQAQPRHDEISCKNDILLMFPDICPDYLEEVSRRHNHRADAVSSAILDKQETDGSYPTRPAAQPLSRKRKRPGANNEPGYDLYYDSDEEGEEGDPESVRAIKLQIATSAVSYTHLTLPTN